MPRPKPTRSTAAARTAAVPSRAIEPLPDAPPSKKRPHEEDADRSEERPREPGSRRPRSLVHGAPRYHHSWSVLGPSRLTIRLPSTHHRLNGSRHTCNTLAHPSVARTVIRTSHPHRVLLLALAVLGLMVLSSVVTETASAKSCAQQVIDDWFDDGRVDKIYPLPCYTQAIKSLPSDLLIYGNAEEEIGRALAFAKKGQPDPGGAGPTPTTSVPTDTTPTTTVATDTSAETGRRRGLRRRPRRRRRSRRRRRLRIPPGHRRCRSRCSCSEVSRWYSSQPDPPGTSGAAERATDPATAPQHHPSRSLLTAPTGKLHRPAGSSIFLQIA